MRILLYPIALLYSFFIFVRNTLFNLKILKSTYFHDIRVISIGNIAVGGTGKTPTVEFIIRKLKDRYKLAILSRGYRRKTKGFIIANKKHKVEEIGDESFQIYQKFPDITVAVCKDRVQGIKNLIKTKKPDIILLDDAFQHRKVSPQKAVLLTEYYHPFYKDHFLPYGRLRDNKFESHRADIVVVTKTPDKLFPYEKNVWRQNLKLYPYQNLYFSYFKYCNLKNFRNSDITIETEKLKNYNIILVTGIARPKYIYDFLKDKAFGIKHFKFADHYNYKQKDIDNIEKSFAELKAQKKIIVTTEKDFVKINELLTDEQAQNWYVQEIEFKFHFDKENDFIDDLIKD